MSMNQESLTLEQSNAVRISLGMAPIGGAIPEGEEPEIDEDEAAEANYAQRRVEMKKAKDESDVKEKIEK